MEKYILEKIIEKVDYEKPDIEKIIEEIDCKIDAIHSQNKEVGGIIIHPFTDNLLFFYFNCLTIERTKNANISTILSLYPLSNYGCLPVTYKGYKIYRSNDIFANEVEVF